MHLFAKRKQKAERPLPAVEDPDLGRMEWSEEDSGWIGTHCGIRFALSFQSESAPATELLVYAKDVLGDATWVRETLDTEKKRLLALDVLPEMRSEIAGLMFDRLYFSTQQGEGQIFATIDGGGGLRAWRLEFHGRHCNGLSFDS